MTTSLWPKVTKPQDQSATAFVYAYLRERIISLEAKPGQLLTEKDITDLLEVSRTPVRETFMRLDGENLVRIVPRRGIIIAPLSIRSIRDLAEARFAIESYAIRFICDKGLDVGHDLGRLIALQSEQYQANHDDIIAMIRTDNEFHTRLVDLVENAELSRLYRSLEDRLIRSGVALFRTEPERRHRALDLHAQLVSELQEHSEPKAMETLETHILRHLTDMTALSLDLFAHSTSS